MTVLSAVQNACAVIALTKPDVLFGSTRREHFELQVLANTCADYIAKDYEWQGLKTLATFAGDGVTADYDLPTDYDRMLKDAKIWTDRLQTPMSHLISTDQWLELDIRQFETVTGAWTIFGDQFHFKPTPTNGEEIKFYYMSNKWAQATGGGATKAAFTLDSDEFRLPEKMLELCIIWKWRANKGLPYAQDQDNYEDEKEKRIAADKGARILRVGRSRVARGVQIAYPISIVP